MKKAAVLLSMFVLFVFGFSQNVFSGEGHHSMESGNSIQTMAGIMLHLNHHPSGADKSALKKIAQHSDSIHEKTIAQAMINLQHKASSADKTKLKAIMGDPKASSDVKALAEIVHNLSHKASGNDKHKLRAMAD